MSKQPLHILKTQIYIQRVPGKVCSRFNLCNIARLKIRPPNSRDNRIDAVTSQLMDSALIEVVRLKPDRGRELPLNSKRYLLNIRHFQQWITLKSPCGLISSCQYHPHSYWVNRTVGSPPRLVNVVGHPSRKSSRLANTKVPLFSQLATVIASGFEQKSNPASHEVSTPCDERSRFVFENANPDSDTVAINGS